MILVLGATGHTGERIARELDRRRAQIRLAARDVERLAKVGERLGKKYETVGIDIGNAQSLDAAMRGVSVVINCVGPFTVYGEPVVAAAVRNNCHYLDITGEQHFMKTMFGKYGSAFKQNNKVLMPACAFEYAIGDTAAAFMAQDVKSDWESIEIVYSFDGVHVSRGTKKSVLQAMASPSLALVENVLTPTTEVPILTGVSVPGKTGTTNAFAFPGGEVLLLPLYLNARNVKTYIASNSPPAMMQLMSRIGPVFAKTAGNWIANLIDSKGKQPEESNTEKTTFTTVCIGKSNGQEHKVVVSGLDPYHLTAVIAAAVGQHLDTNEVSVAGPASASMLGGPNLIMSETKAFGTTWTKS